MEIILLCLYGKVTVIVIFLIIYLYWIWKKVRLIKWEQAPGDTRDWIRNHEKNINKIIKIISGIGLIFMVYCIVIPAILDIPTLVKQEYTVTEGIVESWNYSDEERLEERSISIKDDTGQEKSVIVYSTGIHTSSYTKNYNTTTNYRYNLFHKNLSSYQVYITTLFSVSNSNITKNTKKTKCLNHFILSAPLLFHILNEGDN